MRVMLVSRTSERREVAPAENRRPRLGPVLSAFWRELGTTGREAPHVRCGSHSPKLRSCQSCLLTLRLARARPAVRRRGPLLHRLPLRPLHLHQDLGAASCRPRSARDASRSTWWKVLKGSAGSRCCSSDVPLGKFYAFCSDFRVRASTAPFAGRARGSC